LILAVYPFILSTRNYKNSPSKGDIKMGPGTLSTLSPPLAGGVKGERGIG
jgi:hypothetical protein